MTAQISNVNMSSIHCAIPSICIPSTLPNIDEKKIRDILDALDFGSIDRVDILPRKDAIGKKYNVVFIHFIEWNDTPLIMEARERLLSGQQIKLMYDNPNPRFWKLSAVRSKERSGAPVMIKKYPTRKVTAEMSHAYDFHTTKSSSFVMKYERESDQCPLEIKEPELQHERSIIPIDNNCECCFCQR